MKASDIKTPVNAISGVGPALTKNLAKLNIFTVGDLLSFYPRRYEDRTRVVPIAEFGKNPRLHTAAIVTSHEWFGYGAMKTLKIQIDDGTGKAELICFNRPFMEKSFPVNSILCVSGQFTVKYGRIQSSSFEAVKICDEGNLFEIQKSPLPDTGVIPVYPLTQGLTQKQIQKVIKTALSQYAHGIEDEIPKDLIQKRNLIHKQDAIRMIHQPLNMDEVTKSRSTLVYEELFLFQKTILERAQKRKTLFSAGTESVQNQAPSQNQLSQNQFQKNSGDLSPLQNELLKSLPFSLTDDQFSVIRQMNTEIDRGYTERNEIICHPESGLIQPFTMARLLQGDVGSGKTLVAFFMSLRIKNWKGQTALMAPTEILARQHAETAAKLLSPLGVNVAFLTGNVKSAGRSQILKALKNGEIDLVIGTHALFSNDVVYKDLQLAIIDEQHRFGVMQRQAILAKGRSTENGRTFDPHLLMMSATPIPQTLALTIFGDLDVSTIKNKPIGRKEIRTFTVREGNEQKAYESVRNELRKGHQAYFVYPAIGLSEDDELNLELTGDGAENSRGLKSAEQAFQNLSKNIYPEYKCALLHSKVSEEAQEEILRGFQNNQIQILAATTVIEVGVDVPNATCMVIEGADRFGLSQLHQLRGRVGRGSEQSYCVLIFSKNISDSGVERMKALRDSTDGFFLAEQDLKTRGPGEISGTLQAGALQFALADLSTDTKILQLAREDATQIIDN